MEMSKSKHNLPKVVCCGCSMQVHYTHKKEPVHVLRCRRCDKKRYYSYTLKKWVDKPESCRKNTERMKGKGVPLPVPKCKHCRLKRWVTKSEVLWSKRLFYYCKKCKVWFKHGSHDRSAWERRKAVRPVITPYGFMVDRILGKNILPCRKCGQEDMVRRASYELRADGVPYIQRYRCYRCHAAFSRRNEDMKRFASAKLMGTKRISNLFKLFNDLMI